jgi:hypothetical protein
MAQEAVDRLAAARGGLRRDNDTRSIRTTSFGSARVIADLRENHGHAVPRAFVQDVVRAVAVGSSTPD